MVTFKDRLPPALRRLGADEWTYFVLPDVVFAMLAVTFALMAR